MIGLVPFVLIAAGLLVAAGTAKLRDPAPTTRALRLLVPAATDGVVRLGALVEVALAVALVATPGPAAAGLAAAAYGGFAAFVVLARRRGGPLTSCGCFGSDDTPATRTHALVNVGLAGVLTTWAVHTWGAAAPSTPWTLATNDGAGSAVLALLATALATTLVAAALTVLPQVAALRTTTAAR